MSPVQVKICGITRAEDAALAVELGATMIGFIFADSPRQVSVEKAYAIIQSIRRPVMRAGVFVNATIEVIERAYLDCQLTCVQLHGEETPSFAREVRSRLKNSFVIKALDATQAGVVKSSQYDCDALLFDVPRSMMPTDHEREPLDISLTLTGGLKIPFFIAGGLNPKNAIQYIERFRPAGVDVSSGIESAPGLKSHDAMRDFFRAVRSVK
jgi:phosphoribosylanthranilate isomerase